MRTISAADLLALWERGASRHPLDRSALLYACSRPDQPTDAIADLRLGEINARLLELRAAWFGDRIDAHVDCEHCGERLGLTIAVHELLRPVADSQPGEVTVAGLRCRPPSLRDLAAIARERDGELAAHRLLERCLIDGDDSIAVDDERLREVEDALEEIDPDADFAFDVRCEACGHSGTAQLDPGALLWDDVSARARALLAEVHQLAFAYGWSERDILALTPERRASYLSMVAP
jgi:hypothetical protein